MFELVDVAWAFLRGQIRRRQLCAGWILLTLRFVIFHLHDDHLCVILDVVAADCYLKVGPYLGPAPTIQHDCLQRNQGSLASWVPPQQQVRASNSIFEQHLLCFTKLTDLPI